MVVGEVIARRDSRGRAPSNPDGVDSQTTDKDTAIMSDEGPSSERSGGSAPVEGTSPDHADRVSVADDLRGRDVACPACLYNLRDVVSERCPECGVLLTRRLLAWSDLPWRATIGLVGVCFSTLILVGMSALTTLLMFLGS
jgi:hypothetical protein